MALLTPQQIRRLNAATSILEVFEYYGIATEIDGTHERYRCLCPFHNEKTPSCKIYPDTNSWYAFCCTKGFTPYDLIKEKEADEEQAVQVLKGIAKLKDYDDPIEEVLDILKEKEKYKDKYVDDTTYLISITLRDFLESKINTPDYKQWCARVDQWFLKVDNALDDENLTEADIKSLYEAISAFIKSGHLDENSNHI